MSEPMKISARAGAPLADAYRALTDPAALRSWLAEYAEVELPHRYEFWGRYTPEGDIPRQRLLHADDTTLRFGWTLDGIESVVTIVLGEESAKSTLITLTQTDIPDFETILQSPGSLALAHTFWALALGNLVEYLEGREPELKCDLSSVELRGEMLIEAERGAVYESLINPELFAQWFGARVDIEPYIGGRWAMGGFELDPDPAKIIELVPGEKLSVDWGGMIDTWELADSAGKTKLTFVQSGFDTENPPYDSWMGWLGGLIELRRFHEIPNWRQMWQEVHLDGMPEGMLTLDTKAV